MTIYIIILIVATVGVALVTFVESLSKNKLIKYGSYIVYFLLIELILYSVTDSITIPAVIIVVGISIVILILVIKGSFIVSSGNRTIKYLISFLFLAIAIFTGYTLFDSIMNPIRFNNEMNKRYQETVDELKMVRTGQIAYKNEYNKYTPNLDSLKYFIENGSMTVIRKEKDVPDSIYLQQGNNLEKAEKECLRLGIPGFIRDTIRVAIVDTLYKENNGLGIQNN